MKPFLIFILIIGSLYGDPITDNFPKDEIMRIEDAIDRNGGMIHDDLKIIVYAIRKVENGRNGKEFGIMSVKANDFNSQAGWCVCTVNKNYQRWVKQSKEKDFVVFLGNRYAPLGVDNDPQMLNYNWIKNLHFWIEKLDVQNNL